MAINTRRAYTADDIAELTMLAAESQQLDTEAHVVAVEVGVILEAHGATYLGWQAYHPELAAIIEATDPDKHPFATANTSYIPQVGHYWNSRWNPATWSKRNKRTRRDIDNLRRAMATCEVVNV